MKTIAVIITVFALSLTGAANTGETYQEPIGRLVNNARQEQNLLPLKNNEALAASALKKCQDMQTSNQWGHGDNWESYITVDYIKAGENLAKNYSSDQETVKAWQQSPKHNENLLGDFTDVGYATCEGQLGTVTVQHFIKEKV